MTTVLATLAFRIAQLVETGAGVQTTITVASAILPIFMVMHALYQALASLVVILTLMAHAAKVGL